jgi:hypothetical protein
VLTKQGSLVCWRRRVGLHPGFESFRSSCAELRVIGRTIYEPPKRSPGRSETSGLKSAHSPGSWPSIHSRRQRVGCIDFSKRPAGADQSSFPRRLRRTQHWAFQRQAREVSRR